MNILDKAKNRNIIKDNVGEKQTKKKDNVEEAPYIPSDVVEVYSLRYGKFTLRSHPEKGQIFGAYEFDGYMDSQLVRFDVLQDLVRLQDDVLKLGWIYIADDKAMKQLRIDKLQQNVLKPKDIKNIFSLPKDKMIKAINDLNDKDKKVVRELAIGKLDNDEIKSYKKVNALKENLRITLPEELA